MLGQIDFAPWQCLAELIDNSIDAFIDQAARGAPSGSPRIRVRLPRSAELQSGAAVIEIDDNGKGMSLEELSNAVRAGYSGNDPVEKMGLFGMGFNISTARLGRRTEVWTTTAESEQWVGIVIDFEALEKDKTFHVPVMYKDKADFSLSTHDHGTLIRISRLEPERLGPLMRGSGKSRTKKRLGKIYGRAMERHGITISYDGDKVTPWRHCVWDKTRSVPTREFGLVPAVIDINETLTPRMFCQSCWVWLSEDENECPSCGFNNNLVERNRTVTGWLGVQRFFDTQDFGIDLIRNGRVIQEYNKTFFNFVDSDGDPILEYPIDAVHWGGRIVGELEIDFVRVSHQKDSFDKLDPEWREVELKVRGGRAAAAPDREADGIRT